MAKSQKVVLPQHCNCTAPVRLGGAPLAAVEHRLAVVSQGGRSLVAIQRPGYGIHGVSDCSATSRAATGVR